MKKRLLSLSLALPLFAALAAPAFAAPAPKPADPASLTWNAKYAAAVTLTAKPSAKTNASGDKIASNAQSADFPGLYFYWNDQQKDNGVLLVDPSVFKWFRDDMFTLTAKNSNNYWDYQIAKKDAYLIDGVYAYGIPKQFQVLDNKGKTATESLKNINMVFISGTWRTATFTIAKDWLDTAGDKIADLGAFMGDLGATTPSVTFNGGAYKPGTYTERLMGNDTLDKTFTEDALNWSYHVDEACSYTDYSFEAQGADNDTISLADGDSATVTFTNALRAVTTPTCGSYTIEKVWLDENGDVITDPGLIAEYEATLTITDGDGNSYSLGTTDNVPAGTVVSLTENSSWESLTDKSYSWFEQVGITVNGEPVDSADATIVAGENTTIQFINQMMVDRFATPISVSLPPIPSVQHSDRWWNDFGIIAYSSNTTATGDYFIAFAPDFWDKYASVTIGFGTSSSIDYTVTFTKDNVDGLGVYDRATGTFNLDTHYSHGGAKNVTFSDYDVITFPNPWGSGARQAYLLEVVAN